MTLDSKFKKLGFTQLISDQCVYIQRKNNDIVIVTDMSIFTSSNKVITEIKSEIASELPVNKLGMEIYCTPNSIIITETQYLTHILE
jgi:hypothetical protein